MSELFREAKTAPPIQSEPEATTPTTVHAVASEPDVQETLPTSPNAESSLSAKYLDIENIYDKHPALKSEVTGIDTYLKELQVSGKVDKSDKAVATFMKDLESKAGAKPYESVNQRITKILAYIRFRRVVDN